MLKALERVKSLGPTLLPILLGVRLLVLIIREIGWAGSAFGPVLGSIFAIVVYIIFLGGLIASLILKKENLIFFFSVVLFCSFIYSSCLSIADAVATWRNGPAAMTIVTSVFDFILYGVIAFMVVAHILSLISPKYESFKKYNSYLALGILCITIIDAILTLVECIVGNWTWISYLTNLSYYLAYIPAMVFIYFALFHKEVEVSPKVVDEEPKQVELNEEEQ